MNEETRSTQEMSQAIFQGASQLNALTASTIMMSYKILQYLIRKHNEGLLSKGEIENYKKFVNLTHGECTIKNIPFQKPEDFESFKAELNTSQVAFTILPTGSEKENEIQIAVYNKDAKKYEALFSDYIDRQLSGGEIDKELLKNLTQGKAHIISIPFEDRDVIENKVKPDFDTLEINYSQMPDLNVGDGFVQFLIADKDLHNCKEWFEAYRSDLLKAGKDTADMHIMSEEEYKATSTLSADDYINLDPAAKDLSKKYDKDPSLANALNKAKAKDKTADSTLFESKYNNPNFVMISVDKKTLVDTDASCKELTENSPVTFKCRIPDTSGDNALFLTVMKDNVFIHNPDGERPRYMCFVPKGEKPFIVDTNGKRVSEGFKDGLSVAKHFDDARAFTQKQGVENIIKNLQATKKPLQHVTKGSV